MGDLTEGQRLYAIGDLHGCLGLLQDMLARISADLAARPHPRPRVILLGDYVDRGPDSRGVIAALIALEAQDLPATFLLGNHDSYIQAYLHDPDWYDRTYHWLDSAMGGAQTLASYGVSGADSDRPAATRDAFARAFPRAHAEFLARCALYHQVGGYVFVHAGIRPGVALSAQTRDDLIWIREPFLSATEDFGYKVVHGHTIVERVEHRPNRIALDTGAVKHGTLSCVVLEADAVALLERSGPRRLPQIGGSGLGGSVRSGLRALWPRR